IKIRVSAEKRRFLVVNEGWSNGWRAEVDGVPTALYRADYVAQGLVVPPGDHLVTLDYDPPAFRWGLGVSIIAWIYWLGVVIFSTGLLYLRRGYAASQAPVL
ncbi:MAG: hypothetical protein ACJ78Q_14295, partial [Chloroflexia bacterium]